MSNLDIKFKRLTPFKRCVLQNFPFIEEDFDALTNYGLLCKIVEYLNKVISSQNEVQGVTEELVTAFNNLYDYVNNYFDNLDVQDEINNKLDQMVEDGTLKNFIDEYFNFACDTLYLGIYFENVGGTTPPTHFVTSRDGINFSLLDIKDLTIDGEAGVFRQKDTQISYNPNNKTFYLTTSLFDGNHAHIWTSTNLKDWTSHIINIAELPHGGDSVSWCPKLFFDGDDLYMLLSYAEHTGNKKQLYISQCEDIDNLTFRTAEHIALSNLSSTNLIDPSIIKVNNIYYLMFKNDESTMNLIASSVDLSFWTIINNDVTNGAKFFEGGQLVYIDGIFRMYFDNYAGLRGYYAECETTDLTSVSQFRLVESLCGLRHGSFIKLDEEQTEYVSALPEYSNFVRKPILTSTYLDWDGINNAVLPNATYAVPNGEWTISKLANPYSLENFYFYFTGVNSSITIEKIQVGNSYITVNKTYKSNPTKVGVLNTINLRGFPAVNDNENITDISQYIMFEPAEGVSRQYFTAKMIRNHVYIEMTLKASSATITGQIGTIKPKIDGYPEDMFKPILGMMIPNDKNHNTQFMANGKVFDWTGLAATDTVYRLDYEIA